MTRYLNNSIFVNPRKTDVDFDGDGRTDVSVVRIINGFCQWYIRRSLDNQFYGLQFGLGSDRILPLDFDGDGKTDIAVWRDGVYYVLQSTNAQLSAQQFGAPTDTPVASAFVQ